MLKQVPNATLPLIIVKRAVLYYPTVRSIKLRVVAAGVRVAVAVAAFGKHEKIKQKVAVVVDNLAALEL
jgi:hypothetical protein